MIFRQPSADAEIMVLMPASSLSVSILLQADAANFRMLPSSLLILCCEDLRDSDAGQLVNALSRLDMCLCEETELGKLHFGFLFLIEAFLDFAEATELDECYQQ